MGVLKIMRKKSVSRKSVSQKAFQGKAFQNRDLSNAVGSGVGSAENHRGKAFQQPRP
jgi:hypothetical protein